MPEQKAVMPEVIAAQVAERCYKDADFRKRFMSDPKKTLEQESGAKLPDELNIVVCKNADGTWHIPVPGSAGDKQLSDVEMEKISAGEIFLSLGIGGIAFGSLVAVGASLAIGSSILNKA